MARQLSKFRTRVLQTITKETTPAEVSQTLNCTLEEAGNAMYQLFRRGHLKRPYRGIYAPKDTHE